MTNTNSSASLSLVGDLDNDFPHRKRWRSLPHTKILLARQPSRHRREFLEDRYPQN
ncbi:MAG: hypothetical protein WBA10_00005 [Elainellaceae cyanobacterium]